MHGRSGTQETENLSTPSMAPIARELPAHPEWVVHPPALVQFQLMANGLVSDIFAIAGAVIASVGGATVLIFTLSSWLGKVWATRIMEREKAELAKFHEAHRNELQELSTQRQDALNRKRDVYGELATGMRVLLKRHVDPAFTETERRAFLAAYDKGYIWASEDVVIAIRDLLDIIAKKTAAEDEARSLGSAPLSAERVRSLVAESSRLDVVAATFYQACMLAMRKDAGFPNSVAEYRVASF